MSNSIVQFIATLSALLVLLNPVLVKLLIQHPSNLQTRTTFEKSVVY